MAGNPAAHPPGDTKLEGGGQGGGRERDPGEGRAPFGARGSGPGPWGRGSRHCLPAVCFPQLLALPLPLPPQAPVLQIAGRLNS